MTDARDAAPRARLALRVAWFGTYDRGVGRNAILIDGLRAAGARVVECHAPLWPGTDAKVAAVAGRGGRSLLRLAAGQVRAWVRLARAARALGSVDALVVGPTAHLDLPLARLVARRLGAVLVFDPLISAVETTRDRGVVASGSARGAVLRALERWLFALPELVLVDTAAHGRALAADVGLDPSRAAVLPVGAPAVYRESTPPYEADHATCRVVYCGQYIPLHGVPTILEAADRLRGRPDIAFELVGIGQGLAEARAAAERLHLTGVRFVEAWLAPAELAARHLAPADVCLGVFGISPKADVVVPHKAYMALAAGRALVTGDTTAARELLRPGEAVLVPPGDPDALAAALAALADDPAGRIALAARGQGAWEARFAPGVLGWRLATLLDAAARANRAERARMVGPRHRWRTARLARVLEAATSAGAASTGAGLPSALAQSEVPQDAVPREALLDAGCGDGSLALKLAGSAIDAATPPVVLACDIDPVRVRLAAARVRARGLEGRVLPFVADLEALPLRDASVAGAASGEVLEHVRDDAAAAAELARVLAPGGALALTVPAGPGRLGAFDRGVGHARRYDAAELTALLRGAGLDVEALAAWGVPFGRLYDAAVQRPALRARGRARSAAGGLGRSRLLDAAWRVLFTVDEALEPVLARVPWLRAQGSGLVGVGRKRELQSTRPDHGTG